MQDSVLKEYKQLRLYTDGNKIKRLLYFKDTYTLAFKYNL